MTRPAFQCEHEFGTVWGTGNICLHCSIRRGLVELVEKHQANNGPVFSRIQFLTSRIMAHVGGNNNPLLFDAEGNILLLSINRICAKNVTSFLSYYEGPTPAYYWDYPFSYIKHRKQKHLSREDLELCYYERAWLTWVVNDSPWADAIITKDINSFLKEGVLFDCRANIRILYQAMVALRYISEMPQVVKKWVDFSQYLDPLSNIVASHYFERDGDKFIRCPEAYNSNHWIMDFRRFDWDDLQRFRGQEFYPDPDLHVSIAEGAKNWYRSSDLWTGKRGIPYEQDLFFSFPKKAAVTELQSIMEDVEYDKKSVPTSPRCKDSGDVREAEMGGDG